MVTSRPIMVMSAEVAKRRFEASGSMEILASMKGLQLPGWVSEPPIITMVMLLMMSGALAKAASILVDGPVGTYTSSSLPYLRAQSIMKSTADVSSTLRVEQVGMSTFPVPFFPWKMPELSGTSKLVALLGWGIPLNTGISSRPNMDRRLRSLATPVSNSTFP